MRILRLLFVASPATLARAQGTCSVFEGTDYTGGDIETKQGVESAAGCCQACAEEPRCVVAVLYSGACYLKDFRSMSNAAPVAGRTSCIPTKTNAPGPAPPIPSPGMTSPKFDCNAGFSNWQNGWSAAKKEWCCIRENKGCERSMPYDCSAGFSNWEAGWSSGKQHWCCHFADRGCHKSGPPYNCANGLDTWSTSWSEDKKTWCCAKQGGCPGMNPAAPPPAPVPAPASGSGSCDTVCSHQGVFATCKKRIQWASTHKFWKQRHACIQAITFVIDYCPICSGCALADVGCVAPEPDGTDLHDFEGPARHSGACAFQPDTDYYGGDLRDFRSTSQQECCHACQQEPRCRMSVLHGGKCYLKHTRTSPTYKSGCMACVPGGQNIASWPFDCEAGYAKWKQGWSEAKKSWCCQHADKGCEAPPSVQCHYQLDTDYEGDSVGTLNGMASKEDCCKACGAEPDCVVSVFHGGYCDMKGSTMHPKRNPGHVACVSDAPAGAHHDNRIDFEGDGKPAVRAAVRRRRTTTTILQTTTTPHMTLALCEYKPGVDYEGGDIRFIYDISSRDDCCRACVKEPTCTVSVFFQNFCYLKNSTIEKVGLAGTTACKLAQRRDVVRRFDASIDIDILGAKDRPAVRNLSSIALFAVAGVVVSAVMALVVVRSTKAVAGARSTSKPETYSAVQRSNPQSGSDAIDACPLVVDDAGDD